MVRLILAIFRIIPFWHQKQRLSTYRPTILYTKTVLLLFLVINTVLRYKVQSLVDFEPILMNFRLFQCLKPGQNWSLLRFRNVFEQLIGPKMITVRHLSWWGSHINLILSDENNEIALCYIFLLFDRTTAVKNGD